MVQMVTSREVAGSREAVFAVLADYYRRPALLPTNFTDYAVKRGGQGAGTLVRYRLHAGARVRDCHMEVTEPAPGRVLEERDTHSSLRTRWSVDHAGPGHCRVHVETSWTGASGLTGIFERAVTPRGLTRIYNGVLDRLARHVAS